MSEIKEQIVERLRAIDHMSVEDCFVQSPLYSEAADRIEALGEHVETLVELLDIIKEHWVDYDHVFSIAVHEARLALNATPQDGKGGDEW